MPVSSQAVFAEKKTARAQDVAGGPAQRGDGGRRIVGYRIAGQRFAAAPAVAGVRAAKRPAGGERRAHFGEIVGNRPANGRFWPVPEYQPGRLSGFRSGAEGSNHRRALTNPLSKGTRSRRGQLATRGFRATLLPNPRVGRTGKGAGRGRLLLRSRLQRQRTRGGRFGPSRFPAALYLPRRLGRMAARRPAASDGSFALNAARRGILFGLRVTVALVFGYARMDQDPVAAKFCGQHRRVSTAACAADQSAGARPAAFRVDRGDSAAQRLENADGRGWRIGRLRSFPVGPRLGDNSRSAGRVRLFRRDPVRAGPGPTFVAGHRARRASNRRDPAHLSRSAPGRRPDARQKEKTSPRQPATDCRRDVLPGETLQRRAKRARNRSNRRGLGPVAAPRAV